MLQLKNKFSNINIKVSCIGDIEDGIKAVFFSILEDYCKRFKVRCTKKVMDVSICLVEYQVDEGAQGASIYAEPNKILIQMRDPNLNDWELNPWVIAKFLEILCHEVVHACQYLTNREGYLFLDGKIKGGDPDEEYFFDPLEVEARVLECFYACKFGGLIVDDEF